MKIALIALTLVAGGLVFSFSAQQRSPAPAKKKVVAAAKLRELRKPPQSSAEAVPNTLRVINAARSTVETPMSIPRFFAAGEIPSGQFPVALVETVPTDTQCDIRTRWPDGSVQYAVMSFRASVPPQGSIEVAFSSRETALTPAPLDAQAMLSADYNLGGLIELKTAEGTSTVNVRDMLAKGHFRYWLKGPVVTQVIVEEIAESPEFDIAFNGHKSFHPIFVLTFYAGQPGVKVEFIGENAWMTRLQDIKYSLSLKTGRQLSDPPQYTKDDYVHIARSRWHKTYWSGPAQPDLIIDHNLPYLIYSRALPNYDLSLMPTGASVAQDLNEFARSDKGELGGTCLFAPYMPSTGGRGELGLLTRWDVRYLYTFDPKLGEVVNACAGASAHFPMHFRESRSGRAFTVVPDAASGQVTDALGKVVSIDARPNFCSRDGGLPFSVDKDKPIEVAPTSTGDKTPDTAHQPAFTYVTYLLNGDWYSLEEMYFWTTWNLSNFTPGNCYYCRGTRTTEPFESFGSIAAEGNQRAIGWALRTLTLTATMAPDGSAEKNYFLDKLYNNIAVHEGRFNIKDGILQQDPSRQAVWDYGRNVIEQGHDNPLYFWSVQVDGGGFSPTDTIVDPQKLFAATAPWMNYIILNSLGHMTELGYPSGTLHRRFGRFLHGILSDPGYNPYLVDLYYMPGTRAKGQSYSTWPEVLDAFRPDVQTARKFSAEGGADFDYGLLAAAAASFLTSESMNNKTGVEMYEWLRANYPKIGLMAENPKWAIVPRQLPVAGSISSQKTWARRFQSRRTAVTKAKK